MAKRKKPRLKMIRGGKPASPPPAPQPPSANADSAERFMVALTAFLRDYLVEDQQREDRLEQLTASAVLLRYSAGMAAPLMGDDIDQFLQAAEEHYLTELTAQRGGA